MAVTHNRTVLRARASPRQRRSAGQGLATRPTTVSRLTVVAPINRVAVTLEAVVTVRVRGGKIVPEFVIPLYFHVIYKTDGTGYISRERIDDQIAVLNDDFGGTSFNGDSGYNTSIQFQLAAVDYIEDNNWYTDAGPNATSEFKATLAQSPDEYLNIYTNDAGGGGVLGYATLPPGSAGTNDDGVVMLHNTIGGRNNGYGNYNQGRTLAHEVGHYLGLLHTFDGGVCSNTYTTQDLIVDTPAQSAPDYGSSASTA